MVVLPKKTPGKINCFIGLIDSTVATYWGIAMVLFSMTAAAQQALVSVDPVVQQQYTQTTPILGRLVAKQSGTVASRIDGSVSDVVVQVGDRVTAGQLIAVIDPAALTLQKALAQREKSQAEARIATARAQLALATQEVKRLSSLKSSAAVSKAVFDDATQQQNIAFARVREAEAELESNSASIAVADLNLKYASIVAPFNGTVTAKLTEVGSFLQRGQAVVQLISDQLLELEADVPAERLGGLTPGRKIDISFNNDDRYRAELRAIVPEENPNTRTRRARFNLDQETQGQALAVQQSVMLHIPSGSDRMISSVHKDAIIHRGSDSFVYVVEKETAKMRKVRVGDSLGNRMEVLSGLALGDLAVVRGNERLRPDQKVSVGNDS